MNTSTKTGISIVFVLSRLSSSKISESCPPSWPIFDLVHGPLLRIGQTFHSSLTIMKSNIIISGPSLASCIVFHTFVLNHLANKGFTNSLLVMNVKTGLTNAFRIWALYLIYISVSFCNKYTKTARILPSLCTSIESFLTNHCRL